MDKYTVDLYDWIATQDATFTKDVSFSEFNEKISTNEEYAKSMYNWISSIDNTFSSDLSEQDFIGKVKKKEDSQPVSVEESMVSTSETQEPPALSESPYQPSVEELKKDQSILLAMQKGYIIDPDLEDYARKDMAFTGSPEMPVTPRDKEKSKEKVYAEGLVDKYRTRSKEEIQGMIQDLDLDNKSPYREYASGDTFIEDVYGGIDLARIGIDIKNYDGFLERNGYKKDYLRRKQLGVYQNEFTHDVDKAKYLRLYMEELQSRDVASKQLKRQLETGLHPDLTGDRFSPETGIDINEYYKYRSEKLPALNEALLERERELTSKYDEALEEGNTTLLSDIKFFTPMKNTILDFIATPLEFLGKYSAEEFSMVAEEIRSARERKDFKDTPLHYTVVSGKKVKLNEEEYIVSNDGQIYDVKRGLNATRFFNEDKYNEILELGKSSRERGRSFSGVGLVMEGSAVAGDLVAQVAIQAATSGALGASGVTRLSAVKNIPISKHMGMAMISQGTLGLTRGYEETLRQARAAGINDDESKELASSAAISMGALYAATAVFNPRTKAVNAVTGVSSKVSNAVQSYLKTGKVAFDKKLSAYVLEALKEIPKEGAKELVQENLQQVGEFYTVNPSINEEAGKKVMKDTITIDEFISTSILSFLAGGLMPGAGSLSKSGFSTVSKKLGMLGDLDKVQALDILSKNREEAESIINMHVKTGAYTQQQARELLSDIDAFSSSIERVPKNLSPEKKLEAIKIINEIRKAEQAKAQLDPAFHENVDKQISDKREQLKNAIQKPSTDEVFVSEAPEVSQEVETEVRDTEELTQEEAQVTTQPKPEKVSGVLNRPITLTKLGGSQLDTPIEGNIYVEGQQVVVEDADGNLTEIGNVDEISESSLEEMGIEISQPDVTPTQDGKLLFRKKGRPVDSMGIPKAERGDVEQEVEEVVLTPSKEGIFRNKKGDVTRVTLKDADGQDVTLRGANAEEAAYQILLSEAMSPEQNAFINEQLENDEEFQNELRKAAESTEEQATTDTEQTVEPTAEPEQEVERDPVSEIDALLNEDLKGKIDNGKKETDPYTALEKVKAALKKIAPNVKIEAYSTRTAFLGMLEARGLSVHKDKVGLYNPFKNSIYLDMENGDAEVVYHEAFHAILRNVFGTDKNIDEVTRRMAEALRNVLPSNMVSEIDEFIKAYDEGDRNEEMVTTIFGQMSEVYKSIPKSRNIIKNFLNRLAKLFRLKKFTDNEIIDVLNTISGKMTSGEMILNEDISFLGVTGKFTDGPVSGMSALIGKIDLKRFPVNKNTKVFENTKISEVKGKLTSVMESDRMTGAYIPDTKGNPLYKFYGGLFYPIITGNMWSSGKKDKAETIAKNAMANRDEDGYVYMTPIIMRPGSHMSNQNMLNTVWEIMKHDLRSPTTRVTKARFTEYVEKALSLKNVNKSFEDFGIKKSDSVETIIEKLTPFMTQPSDKKTFQQRRAIVKSILGDPKVKEDRRFPSAGSFTEVASKFEEELTKGTDLWDFVVVYRTKGNLNVQTTDPSDPMHHDSYPHVIKTDAPVEVMVLDKAYNISQAIPGMKKSSGGELNFDEYAKSHEGKSDRYILSQYGRTAKLSYAAGKIKGRRVDPQYAVSKAKDAGFSDADIRAWGNKNGFSTSEINDAIKKYEEEKRFRGMEEEGLFNPDSNIVKRFFDKAYRKLLSARGFLAKSTQVDKEVMNGVIEANIKKAITTINDLDKVLKKYKENIEEVVENLDAFLRGDQDVNLPEDVREVATAMRAHIDGLSKQLVEVGLSEIGTESYAAIMSNIGSYMNRSFEIFDNANYTPSDQTVTAAKNYLRNAMRSKAYEIAMQENNDPVIVLEEMVDREIEKILNKNLESDYKNAASKVGAKKTSLMDRRLDIPFEIRVLMGEYTDPAANYARSVKNIVHLVESHRFTNKVRKAGEGIFLFDKPTGEYNVLIASEGSRSLDPLNGMYTSQEIYDALQNRPLISFDNKILNSAYEYWLKSVGTVKYSKTILSVGTHAKNVFGNLAFMMYNGYFNPSDYNNAYNVVKNDFLGQTNAEQRAKLDEYIKAGIISQSVTLQEIRSMFSGDDDFDVKLIKRHQDNGMAARLQRATKKGASKIADLYQAEDDFFKIVAYEAEKRRYAKAFHSKAYTDLDQDQKKEVDDYVSEIVKNILPNYSRIGQIREIIRAVPLVGTFISFEMEAWRTAYNTVKLASDEIKDKRTQAIGLKRMSGIMAVSAAKALLYSSLGLIGGGDEEDEDDKSVVDSARQFMPPWAKNSNVVVKDIKDGKFKYINVSASDPHGSLDEVLISFLRGDNAVDSFMNAFKQFSSPFFTSDILAGAAMEIIRNEDKLTGKPIFLETDNAFEVSQKFFEKIWKIVEPGTMTSINKIYESETSFNEFTGQVTGLKAHNIEIGKQTFFRARDISNRSRVVVRDYTSGKYQYKDGKIDRSELNALYTRANENHKEVYGDLVKLYEAGIKLGAKRRDMVQSMKDAGVPAYVVRGIIQGYVPNLNR